MKKIFFSFAFTLFLFSDEIPNNLNIDYIKSLQNPIERDFYINEYLKTEVTPNQAYDVLPFISNMRNETFFIFAKKFNHDETLGVAQCMNMDTRKLVESYADCIVSGLSIRDLSTLSAIDFDIIKQKVADKYPEFLNDIKVISASIPFTRLVVKRNDQFFKIYSNVSNEFRTKYFNYKLPQKTFDRIFTDKKRFDKFLQITLTNSKLNYLNASLKNIDDTELSFNSSFLLALNSIRENDLPLASNYLKNALSKTSNTKEINKINFWQYLVAQDNEILTQLASSNEVDFYSYLANELLKNKIDSKNLIENIEEIDSIKKELGIKTTALLYAISKVKSNFNEKMISNDFETGMFQLKPSLVKSLYESMNKEYIFENLFERNENINTAKLHLTNLEFKFSDIYQLIQAFDNTPILRKEDFFTDIRKTFEPFFSIEILSNEGLDYQKEILLYYVIYNNNLTKKKKEKITLNSLCQTLLESVHKQGE